MDVESLIEDHLDDFLCERLREGSSRAAFAIVAMNIAEDRYSAGTQAAAAVLYIREKHGDELAAKFIADLEHHQR